MPLRARSKSLYTTPNLRASNQVLNRRHFGILGAASLLSAPSVLRAGRAEHVIIIGAGAAGLTAGFHLKQAGVSVQILEASRQWGGRLRRDTTLASRPIDLGAEWIHTDADVLGRILGQNRAPADVTTMEYAPQDLQILQGGKRRRINPARYDYSEVKFHDSTWYGFFERHLLPQVAGDIKTQSIVRHISKTDAGITVHLSNGQRLSADKVIVTVPLPILQRGMLSLSEDLISPAMQAGLHDLSYGTGFKVFMRFSERFYPDVLGFGPGNFLEDETWEEKLYFDAMLGKQTKDNVLALFTASQKPIARARLRPDMLLNDVLGELSDIFGPVVRRSFERGIVQNWTTEPFILGSYSMDNNSEFDMKEIFAPVENALFFAGEALGGTKAQSTVHGAAFSGMAVAKAIVDD